MEQSRNNIKIISNPIKLPPRNNLTSPSQQALISSQSPSLFLKACTQRLVSKYLLNLKGTNTNLKITATLNLCMHLKVIRPVQIK